MKHRYFAIAILFLGHMTYGQNQECQNNLSIYDGYVKTKNLEDAYLPWKMVYDSCPGIHWANFSHGKKILEYKIGKSSDSEKKRYIKELLDLYDHSIEVFPEKTKETIVIIDKVKLRYDHKMISNEEIYTELGAAFEKDRINFKDPKALYLYFSSAMDLNKLGKTAVNEVFEVYDVVVEKIEEENLKLTDAIAPLLQKEEKKILGTKEKQRLRSYTSYSENYGRISSSIEVKLGALANCDNLIDIYQKNFMDKKEDVVWVKKAVSRMFNKKCMEAPMFKKLFDQQLHLDPSADAYLYSGILKIKEGDTQGAILDFNEAMELEDDSKKKSDIAYKIAAFYEKDNKLRARDFAQKAIKNNASHGKAYLLLASLYAGSANDCGSDPFEKRAMYWKAANLARRAIKVDPSLRAYANKFIKSYEGRAPTKEMIFNKEMGGKTIFFKCWIGGSVVVPKL